jgi:eukaryotic-like serine/threonine-protein kinase
MRGRLRKVGQMEAVQVADLTGSRVSHYAIVDLIASGGMGQVYHARDERLRRDVAIKVMGRDSDERPELHRDLKAEALALSRLNHPHVAGIYDFLTEAGRDFIVMEFVSGATLADIIAGGPLPMPEVYRLGRQLIRGLAAAHAAQVVHRDIKPANLKITSSGDLKILDFGLATVSHGAGTSDVSTVQSSAFGPAGTLPYMAPEQLSGDAADERSDIFSAGAVLYEMATGRQAFPQRQLAKLIDAVLHHDPIAPSLMNPYVPKGFEGVVMKAMRKDAGDRFQSAAELAEALASSSATPTKGHVTAARRLAWLTGVVW